MATNLDGPFLCTQAAAPLMLENGGGAVVNIASISGLRASTLRVAYGTSKAALIHLTKQQAAELGDVGIRVNCIAPGLVKTDFAKALWDTPEAEKRSSANNPLRRLGEPDDIAGAAVLLASKAGSWMTGQAIVVDGGSTC